MDWTRGVDRHLYGPSGPSLDGSPIIGHCADRIHRVGIGDLLPVACEKGHVPLGAALQRFVRLMDVTNPVLVLRLGDLYVPVGSLPPMPVVVGFVPELGSDLPPHRIGADSSP